MKNSTSSYFSTFLVIIIHSEIEFSILYKKEGTLSVTLNANGFQTNILVQSHHVKNDTNNIHQKNILPSTLSLKKDLMLTGMKRSCVFNNICEYIFKVK